MSRQSRTADHPRIPRRFNRPNRSGKRRPSFNLFSGRASSYVPRWAPGKDETELRGITRRNPNGCDGSDERAVYFNAWTAKEIHRYDLKAGKEASIVKLDFMPDNIFLDTKRQLAAGVKGTRGNSPPASSTPINQAFGIAEIDPGKMGAKTIFDSEGKGALIRAYSRRSRSATGSISVRSGAIGSSSPGQEVACQHNPVHRRAIRGNIFLSRSRGVPYAPKSSFLLLLYAPPRRR